MLNFFRSPKKDSSKKKSIPVEQNISKQNTPTSVINPLQLADAKKSRPEITKNPQEHKYLNKQNTPTPATRQLRSANAEKGRPETIKNPREHKNSENQEPQRLWAVYARVSLQDQDPQSQLHALRQYVQEKGLKVHREYVDHVTGSFEKREVKGLKAPALEEMMKDVREKTVTGVLIYKFDRFARSLIALVQALAEFERIGCSFVSITQSVDSTTAQGKLMFQILGAFSEFERQMIIERTRAGIAKARAMGVRIGRPIKNQAACDEVLALHKQGLSLRKIAPRVNYSPSGVFKIIKRSLKTSAPVPA